MFSVGYVVRWIMNRVSKSIPYGSVNCVHGLGKAGLNWTSNVAQTLLHFDMLRCKSASIIKYSD